MNQTDIQRAFSTHDPTLLREFVREHPAVQAAIPEQIIAIIWKMGRLLFEEQGVWYFRGGVTNEQLQGPFESEAAAITALKQAYYQSI